LGVEREREWVAGTVGLIIITVIINIIYCGLQNIRPTDQVTL
jgi:hypothetical protein